MNLDLDTICACRIALARCRLVDFRMGLSTAKMDAAYIALRKAVQDEVAEYSQETPALLRRQAE